MKNPTLHKAAMVATVLFICFQTGGAQSLFSKAIDEIGQSYVQEKGNHGLVIGIIAGDDQGIKGFGTLSRDHLLAPDGKTIFEIGSLTAVFTTSLMMEESMAGSFALSDPIKDYLPEGVKAPSFYPYVCREVETNDPVGDHPRRATVCEPDVSGGYFCITFCDLADHTSGLPNAPKGLYDWNPFTLADQLKNPYRDYHREELYQRLPSYQLDQAPGIAFNYSNLGMALLGNVVADIAGQEYTTLLAEKILMPLNLQDTRFELNPEQSRRFAPGHNRRGKPIAHWAFDAMAPAGGLRSTATDLLAFLAANLQTDASPLGEVFEQVQQPRLDTEINFHGLEASAGYGWLTTRLSEESNLPIVWNSGGTGGFRSFIGFSRDNRIAVIILSNSANAVDEVGFSILKSLNEERREN